MIEFPETLQIPMAEWVDAIMDWVLVHWGPFFDLLGHMLLQVLLYIERFLLWLPWPLVVVVVAVAAWRNMGRWYYGLLMAGFMMIIGSFGYWALSMMTLAIVIASVIISLLIGIPASCSSAWARFRPSLQRSSMPCPL